MKKTITIALILLLAVGLFAGCTDGNSNQPTASETPVSATEQDTAPADLIEEPETSGADAPDTVVGAPTAQTISLDVGQFEVYDFGDLKLHAYETKDPIANESYLLETAHELIAIELAPFYDNIEELREYIVGLDKPLTTVIVAYHPAGADQFSDTHMYASEGLGEQALVAGFVEAFGDIFNGNLPTEYELIETGTVTISGVEFNVIETDDAFDLEILAINTYFTHMLGAGTHNILVSVDQIDAMIAQMKEFQAKNYSLILTGHDVPRTVEIAAEKTLYLEQTKALIESSDSAEEFIAAMQEAFPGYYGENYLEMSAGALFA